MSENLRRLNMLIKKGHIKPRDFYNIQIRSDGVSLQGRWDYKKEKRYREFFGLHERDGDDWMQGKKFNVTILLTT